ncbi:unnamed protein product [Urochloa humidicola]
MLAMDNVGIYLFDRSFVLTCLHIHRTQVTRLWSANAISSQLQASFPFRSPRRDTGAGSMLRNFQERYHSSYAGSFPHFMPGSMDSPNEASLLKDIF